MPRPSRGIPLSTRTISLPDDVWAAIDARFHDPVKGKLRYGALTTYFERLVRADFRARKGQTEDVATLMSNLLED